MLEALFERERAPRERLLWTGRPRRGLRLSASDAMLIPFSLLWGGFAFFWEYMVIHTGGPLIMTVFGVPFVLSGVYLIIGRFFVDAWKRSRTAYAVTDQRALILTNFFLRKVASFRPAALPEITMTERTDGSGTIAFGSAAPFANWYRGAAWPGMEAYNRNCFDQIEDVRVVHQLLRSIQNNHSI